MLCSCFFIYSDWHYEFAPFCVWCGSTEEIRKSIETLDRILDQYDSGSASSRGTEKKFIPQRADVAAHMLASCMQSAGSHRLRKRSGITITVKRLHWIVPVSTKTSQDLFTFSSSFTVQHLCGFLCLYAYPVTVGCTYNTHWSNKQWLTRNCKYRSRQHVMIGIKICEDPVVSCLPYATISCV